VSFNIHYCAGRLAGLSNRSPRGLRLDIATEREFHFPSALRRIECMVALAGMNLNLPASTPARWWGQVSSCSPPTVVRSLAEPISCPYKCTNSSSSRNGLECILANKIRRYLCMCGTKPAASSGRKLPVFKRLQAPH
jgi:hypothetical protein